MVDLRDSNRRQSIVSLAGRTTVANAALAGQVKRCVRASGHQVAELHAWLSAPDANGQRRLVTWGDRVESILTALVVAEAAVPADPSRCTVCGRLESVCTFDENCCPVSRRSTARRAAPAAMTNDVIFVNVRIMGQLVATLRWPAWQSLPARGDMLDVPDLGAVLVVDRYMMTGGGVDGVRELVLNTIAARQP